jgi:hypothetical protein
VRGQAQALAGLKQHFTGEVRTVYHLPQFRSAQAPDCCRTVCNRNHQRRDQDERAARDGKPRPRQRAFSALLPPPEQPQDREHGRQEQGGKFAEQCQAERGAR